jgi:tripeptide aminopeptidase
MSNFYEQVRDRFIRYAKVDTQSSTVSKTAPTTMKQKVLGEMLKDELVQLGVKNVYMSDECCVYGTIPSNIQDSHCKSIGFIAHMDTSPDAPSENIKPWVLMNYQGGDILLNKKENIVMEEAKYTSLRNYIGKDLILSDGTTLLGGDDKASIAAIMTMTEYYCTHPEAPHGPIQIGFTPDEEVGHSIENFDIKRFDADLAYTLDGDSLGIINYETFNAGEATLTIHGLNVHPGTAKDIMKNAVEIGSRFIAMLPELERPHNTELREGYYHPNEFEGTVDKATIHCLIRDHSMVRFNERKAYIKKCVEKLNHIYGEGTVELSYSDTYYSMEEPVRKVFFMIDYLKEAIESCNETPSVVAFRGGTDGSWLSQKGLTTPNLSAGYENAHGRFEYVPIQSMEKNVDILIKLIGIYAKEAAK